MMCYYLNLIMFVVRGVTWLQIPNRLWVVFGDCRQPSRYWSRAQRYKLGSFFFFWEGFGSLLGYFCVKPMIIKVTGHLLEVLNKHWTQRSMEINPNSSECHHNICFAPLFLTQDFQPQATPQHPFFAFSGWDMNQFRIVFCKYSFVQCSCNSTSNHFGSRGGASDGQSIRLTKRSLRTAARLS